MITVKFEGLQEVKKVLDPKLFKKAIVRSLDRSSKAGRQEALDSIREKYNIKESDLRREIKTDLYPSKLEAIIKAKGRPISIFKFSPRQVIETVNKKTKALYARLLKARAGRKAAGVTVEIVKGKRRLVKGAFVQSLKSGHVAIFKREGKERHPIKKLSTIGISEMFGSRNIIASVKKKVIETWEKTIKHEVEEGWKHYK